MKKFDRIYKINRILRYVLRSNTFFFVFLFRILYSFIIDFANFARKYLFYSVFRTSRTYLFPMTFNSLTVNSGPASPWICFADDFVTTQ